MPQSQAAAISRNQEEQKQTKPNERKSNKHTKSTKINCLFPKRGNPTTAYTTRNACSKDWKTQEQNNTRQNLNKLPSIINHKATKSKINTGTTALERSAE